MTTLMSLLICLMVVIVGTLALTLWMWDRATKRWMMMFCEKLSITPVGSMEADVKRVADAMLPLIPPRPEMKKRFSVPLPGAEMFRKDKTQ